MTIPSTATSIGSIPTAPPSSRPLVEQERDLFQLDPTVYLYDLTSTYFEGQAKRNPKAKRGYSRDKRPDCKQVVVGLVIGREGFPIAHEVFEGNTQDRKTLGRMLDLLKDRVGMPEGSTVVVDRGMAYAENLVEIRQRKHHYVVAARQPERDNWLDQFEEPEGFELVPRQPSPLNPFQKKSVVRVKPVRQGEELIVLCTSEERVAKDRAIREKQEQRFLADLDRLQQRIEKGRLKREIAIGEAIGRLKRALSPRCPLSHDHLGRDHQEAGSRAERRQESQGRAARWRLLAAHRSHRTFQPARRG